MMVGTGRASSLGILIRSGEVLERLAHAGTVAFDKTGTLTERFAAVASVVPAPGVDHDRLLALAAAVEAESDHPIAVAIGAAAPTTRPASDIEVLAGAGVRGRVDGRLVTIGRADPASTSRCPAPGLRRRAQPAGRPSCRWHTGPRSPG